HMYCGTLYRYLLGRCANLERRVDTQRDRGIQGEPGFAILLESSVTNGDVINAHRQGRKDVEAHGISLDTLPEPRPGVERGDSGAGNDAARGVLHRPRDAARDAAPRGRHTHQGNPY